jgi:hypothetical protein
MAVVFDPIASVKQEMAAAKEKAAAAKAAKDSPKKAPVIVRLKDGQRIKIRPLANITEYGRCAFHYKYGVNGQATISAVCATSFKVPECALCQNSDKALKASDRFYLPVWVRIVEMVNSRGGWTQATWTDKEGEVHDVEGGLRYLEMKISSPIFASLIAKYENSESHDIRDRDFIIERQGATMNDTKYVTDPQDPSRFRFDKVLERHPGADWTAKGTLLRIYEEFPPILIEDDQELIAPSVVSLKASEKKAITADDFADIDDPFNEFAKKAFPTAQKATTIDDDDPNF